MVGTALITGATGTVGSEVAKQLSLAGQRVRGAVHSTTRASSHEKLKGVELVEIDYNKPGTLVAAFKDIDKLFLLTPASSEAAEIATNLVNEAKKGGIRHIVKQSIIG
ncbi:MAG: NAD(P)H-binding protein, partial [Candidatus Nitrosopolaris sp.]